MLVGLIPSGGDGEESVSLPFLASAGPLRSLARASCLSQHISCSLCGPISLCFPLMRTLKNIFRAQPKIQNNFSISRSFLTLIASSSPPCHIKKHPQVLRVRTGMSLGACYLVYQRVVDFFTCLCFTELTWYEFFILVFYEYFIFIFNIHLSLSYQYSALKGSFHPTILL